MEKKYKIKIDAGPPSDDEIMAHKNFDRVMAKYGRKKQPASPLHSVMYKGNKLIPVLFLALAMAALIIFVIQYKKGQGQQQQSPGLEKQIEMREGLQKDSDN